MTGELWDAYDKDGNKTGDVLVRGEPIPEGLYHIVCEVLVRHADGDYLLMRRDLEKDVHPGCWEASAGGSALRGEDPLSCIQRELLEETGIAAEKSQFEEVAAHLFEKNRCLFRCFFCTIDGDKDRIRYQKGETIDHRWADEAAFQAYLHSDQTIPNQILRYRAFYQSMGYDTPQ